MKRHLTIIAMALFLVSAASGDELSEAAGYLAKAYPAAEKGMTRFAILLPKLEHEEHFKVEIIVGKSAIGDSANTQFFGGKIQTVNIDGWGFDRYVVKDLGTMMSTLVGGGTPKEKFITVAPIVVRYNSRLPIAVYVPEGAAVRYRIWSTTPESKEMPKG